jgi:ribosomal protein S18 acetylase RimI-like enzyme
MIASRAAILPARRAQQADVAALETLQRAAYARNRTLTGVEPMPLLADYNEIVAQMETWVFDGDGLEGALALQYEPGVVLIWSIATAPHAQERGLGNRMLAFAEQRARENGCRAIRLYTNARLAGNIAWYKRRGYVIDCVEQLADRHAVHMSKRLT